jgi:hypothetical protein
MKSFLQMRTRLKVLSLIAFAFFTGNGTYAQKTFDSFSDGDFTVSPVWGGNTGDWTIAVNSDVAAGATGSNTLRLNVASGGGTKYLSSQVATWGSSQEWSFWVGRRAQAFTGANQQYFWLYANEANLTSSTVDGYRVAIGDNDGGDEIRIEYIVNNALSTTVITSSSSISNGLEDIGFLVRVTRTGNGVWQLFTSTLPGSSGSGAIATDNTAAQNVTISQGTGTNNSLSPAANGYVGVAALHSTGGPARAAAEFDQIRFSALGVNINGIIAANEYGNHTNGQNQETNGATWFMNWDDDYLYMAATNLDNSSNSNNRRVLVYIDRNPATPVNSSSNADGTIAGFAYSNSNLGTLPFRADCFFSIETNYRQLNIANGSNGWGSNNTDYGVRAFGGSNNTVEIAIPWSVVTAGGTRPAAFNWTGYVTDANAGGNYFYEMPTENPGGLIGTSIPVGSTAGFERYYTVSSTVIGSSTPPFSRNSYVFNRLVDATGFGAISIYDFTMNTTGRTLTRGSGAWSIAGDFRNNAGTVNFGSVTDGCTITGSLFNSGTLTLSTAVGGDVTVRGNLTDNGTFNANNRAVFFDAGNVQDIQGSGTFDIPYVRINKTAGRVRLLSNLTCPGPNGNNAMEITGTTSILDLNGFTLNLGQAGVNSTYSGTGFIRSSPTSSINILGTGALGTILFDQTTDGTTNSIKDFTVNRTSSGTVTLGNKLIVSGGLSANNEGTLTVTNGTLNTGGFLVIGSNANGTARIAQNTSGGTYINGNVQVERFIPANTNRAWRLLGVPLATSSTQTIRNAWMEGAANPNAFDNNAAGYGTILTGSNTDYANDAAAQAAGYDQRTPVASIRRFDPATFTLQNVGNISTKELDSENGYFVYIRGDRSILPANNTSSPTATTLRSTGTVQQGSKTYTVGAAQRALIGNPFASAVNLNNIDYSAGNGVTGATVSVWDPKLSSVGAYVTLTRSGANYEVTTNGGGSYPANGIVFNNLQSGQAFFINEAAGVGGGSVIVPETAKATGSVQVFRPNGTTSIRPRMFVTLANAANAASLDGVYVNFDGNFSNDIDNYDGLKSNNFADNIAILKGGKRLVVEQRGAIVSADTVFFGISQMRQANFKLQFKLVEMDATLFARLEDKFTGINTVLTINGDTEYPFTVTADAASSAADRFRLVFLPLGSGPLPVNFVNIKAIPQAGNVAVSWETGSELNVERYEIEKSANGREFAKVATQSATGNGVYNWLDVNVAAGTQWYRIKAIDRSGQFKYSAIVKINANRNGSGITVWPNPVKGNDITLQLSNEAAGRYNIRLTNAAGQIILTRNIQHAGGSASQSISLSSQAIAGVYQLEIVAPNGNRKSQKLIIE